MQQSSALVLCPLWGSIRGILDFSAFNSSEDVVGSRNDLQAAQEYGKYSVGSRMTASCAG